MPSSWTDHEVIDNIPSMVKSREHRNHCRVWLHYCYTVCCFFVYADIQWSAQGGKCWWSQHRGLSLCNKQIPWLFHVRKLLCSLSHTHIYYVYSTIRKLMIIGLAVSVFVLNEQTFIHVMYEVGAAMQWKLFVLDFLQNIWLQNIKSLRVSEWSHYSISSLFFYQAIQISLIVHVYHIQRVWTYIFYSQIWSTVVSWTSFQWTIITMATGFASPLIEACGGDPGSSLANEHNG